MASWRVRFAAVVLVVLVAAVGCDWVLPGFDAGLSRNNPSEPSLNATTVQTLHQQFSVTLAGVSSFDPIVADGRLIAASNDQAGTTATVEAFDANTGKRLWSTTLLKEGDLAEVTETAYASGTIYVGVMQAGFEPVPRLYAVSASNGAIKWSTALPTASSLSSITVNDGKVLVPVFLVTSFPPLQTGIPELVALDDGTGATLWTWVGPNGSSSVEHVVVGPGGLIAVNRGVTAIVNEADGSTRQTLNVGVVASADGLFYADPFGVVAIDPFSGATVWSSPPNEDLRGFAISGQSLVVPDKVNGTISAYNPRTGALIWTAPEPAGLTNHGAPAIAGGLFYFLANLGDPSANTLTIYDTASGAVVSSIVIPGGGWDPIVAEGKVYVISTGVVDNQAQTDISAFATA